MSKLLEEIKEIVSGAEKIASENEELNQNINNEFEKLSYDEAEYLKNRLKVFGIYIENTDGITKTAFEVFEELLNKVAKIHEEEVVVPHEKSAHEYEGEINPLRAFCLGVYNNY